MANRFLNQFCYSFEKAVVKVFAVFDGAGGTADCVLKMPTAATGRLPLVAANATGGTRGVKTVTYNAATGNYRVTLQDTYTRLLHFSFAFEAINGTPISTQPNGARLVAQSMAATGGSTLDFLFAKDATPQTGVVLDANSRVYAVFHLSNSTSL